MFQKKSYTKNIMKKKIYLSSVVVPFVNNSFCCSICGSGDTLETLKNKLKNIKIEKNNIVEKPDNYANINDDVADLKNITNGKKDDKIIKKESIVDITEYFKAFNEYLGKEYKDKNTFNNGFDKVKEEFENNFKDKVDFDFDKCKNYLVIEGTVKVPNDATIDKLKEQYWNNEFEKNMFNLITNCINNNNKFYVYFDNLNKDSVYDGSFKPRNKNAKKELTRKEVKDEVLNKHKDKNLIILYVFGKKTPHVFTTQG